MLKDGDHPPHAFPPEDMFVLETEPATWLGVNLSKLLLMDPQLSPSLFTSERCLQTPGTGDVFRDPPTAQPSRYLIRPQGGCVLDDSCVPGGSPSPQVHFSKCPSSDLHVDEVNLHLQVPVRQWLSTSGFRTLRGLRIRHPTYQVFTLGFITVGKPQL